MTEYKPELLDIISPRGRPHAHGLERLHKGTYLYFIRCGDFIKVGYASDIEAILRQFRRFNPVPVSVLGYVRGGATLEREVHKLFGAFHVRGEWFDVAPELLAFAAEHSAPWTEPRGPRVRKLNKGKPAQ